MVASNGLGVTGEANPHVLGAGDDVGVGEDLALRRDDHPGPDGLPTELAATDASRSR